jgi:hypothetical protein
MSSTETTRYEYTDLNGNERLANAIATAVSQSRHEAYRRRALDVIGEYNRRVATRRAETELTIQEFYEQNPELRSRAALVTAVAPWAAAEGGTGGRATLERTKAIIDSLTRGNGLTSTWYGTFAQTTTSPRGETTSFSEFVRVEMKQVGSSLTGRGMLGSGEVIELRGQVSGESLTATVSNTTSGINTRMTALAAPSQVTGTFSGVGAGMRMEGAFTLVR